MTGSANEVVIRLSADEALVLFEWVQRAEEERLLPQVTEDAAEVIALTALSSLLERELVEPHP